MGYGFGIGFMGLGLGLFGFGIGFTVYGLGLGWVGFSICALRVLRMDCFPVYVHSRSPDWIVPQYLSIAELFLLNFYIKLNISISI